MTISQERTSQRVALPQLGVDGKINEAKPVKWFAWFGAFCLILQVYLYSRWVLSGNFVRTPTGPDPVPGWMSLAAHSHEVASLVITAVCGYFYVVRPWRRSRRLGLPGMLFLGLFTLYWQDLGSNYLNHVYMWNTGFWLNRGAWYNFIPGWVSPNSQQYAEPLLFAVGLNIWFVIVPGIVLAKSMRWLKTRRPQTSGIGLVAFAFGLAAPFDLVIEMLWVRLGLYIFAGTIPSVTLFQGRYYQFPLYEPLFAGLYLAVFAALFYFVNDKGETVVERGIDKLKIKPQGRPVIRFLALAGLCNLVLLSYNVMMAIVSMYPTYTWSKDVAQDRSYLRNGVCGAGTAYACPSKEVPVPRQGGAHVGPDGQLIIPEGMKVPSYRP